MFTAFDSSKNEIKLFIIISSQDVKACLVPFPFSLQSKIVWENIQISRWFQKRLGEHDRGQAGIQKKMRPNFLVSSLSLLENARQQACVERVSGSPPCGSLPFGFSLTHARGSGPASPSSAPGLPFQLVPLHPETRCAGERKPKMLADLQHGS